MPAESAKAIWEVVAGLLPGQPDHKHTRRFGITSSEWESGEPEAVWHKRMFEAYAYATHLQNLCAQGMEVNWVRIDFVWP